MEKKYQDLKNQIEETVKKELDFEKYGFIRDYKKEEREYKRDKNYINMFLEIGVYTFWFKYKGLSISFDSDHREIKGLNMPKGSNGSIFLESDPKIFTTVGAFFPELLQARPKIFKIRDNYHKLYIITNDTLKEYSKALDEVLEIIDKNNKVINELEKNNSVKIYHHGDKYYATTYKIDGSESWWWENITLPVEVKSKYCEIKITDKRISSIKKKTNIPVEIIELKPQA